MNGTQFTTVQNIRKLFKPDYRIGIESSTDPIIREYVRFKGKKDR